MSRVPLPEVVEMVGRVCNATRLAALRSIDAALQLAADAGPEALDRARDTACEVLSRAAVMQAEIDRFVGTIRRPR